MCGEPERKSESERLPTVSVENARSNALCLASFAGPSVGEPLALVPGDVTGDSQALVAEREELVPVEANHFGCSEGVTGIIMNEWMT